MMTLDRGTANAQSAPYPSYTMTLLHKRVYHHISNLALLGHRLPTQREMAAEFDITIRTLRGVYAALIAQDALQLSYYLQEGGGLFVQARLPDGRTTSPPQGEIIELRRKG